MTPINDNVIQFPVKKNKTAELSNNEIKDLTTLFMSALHEVNEISTTHANSKIAVTIDEELHDDS